MCESYLIVQAIDLALKDAPDDELAICWSAVPSLISALTIDLSHTFGAPIEVRTAHVCVSSLSHRHGAPYVEFAAFPANSRIEVASVCCLFVLNRILVVPRREPDSPIYLNGFGKIVAALANSGNNEADLRLIVLKPT